MRILIAEDDRINIEILKNYLKEYGQCESVYDGQQAVEAFKKAHQEENPYNLVCLDIMMPKMDGQQALKKIREIEKRMGIFGAKAIKIIMITGLDDQKNMFEAYIKGGAAKYLVKPIQRAQLKKELEDLKFKIK